MLKWKPYSVVEDGISPNLQEIVFWQGWDAAEPSVERGPREGVSKGPQAQVEC